MIIRKIRLSTIEAVKEFVKITEKCNFDIDLCKDRYTIDAKSIMGIFSMDLTKVLELRIHSDDESTVDLFKNYLV